MKKTNLLLVLLLALFTVQYSQAQTYCTGGPTSGADSNIGNVSLTGDGGTSFDYTPPCPGTIGLNDQTASSVDVTAGTLYTGSVTWSTCGGNFGNSGTIWIDWNANFTFEPSEVVHTFDGTPTVTEAFSFTIPVATGVNGVRRMRVMQQETSLVPPLDPCASYSWGSKIDFNVNVSGATGTPAPIPYCSSGPTSTADSNLGGFSLTGDNTSISYTPPCPGITGLDDQTASSADVFPGQSYTGSVTWATCGGNFGNSGTIWIDWNQNSTFDLAEVIHTFDGTPTVTEVVNFTVPNDAIPGTTTMRVKQQETSTVPPLNPCGSYSWGSVVDFSIAVTDPCPQVSDVTISGITDVAANVNFNSSGEPVNIEITASGAGQGNGTTTAGASSPHAYTGLTPSTTYDVYLQKDCANGFQSPWVGPFSFTTLDPCNVPTGVSFSNITNTSATAIFSTPNDEPANIQVTTSGAGQGNGIVVSDNNVTSPYAISGLAGKTTYDVYVQTDCGPIQSAWAGPFSFTTLVTPKISIVDSSGNGLPNIADPCDCADPGNIEDPATMEVTYFHDFITVVSNPGETWELVAVNSGQIYDNALNPIPVGTTMTEVSPGLYRIDVLHESLVGFSANFNRTVNPMAVPLTAANTCNGVACAFAAVPTMSEWGMILFALIMLSFGVVFVMRQQVAVAGMSSSASASFSNGIPFDKASFGKLLAYVMIGLAAAFAIAISTFGYEMTNADVPGSLMAGPALAYLIHLIMLSSNKEG